MATTQTEKGRYKEWQTVSSETHVYQYSFMIPVNRSDFAIALSDIHNCIQMSTHWSYSQNLKKKKKVKSCTHWGVERTWQTFETGSSENPYTFPQQNVFNFFFPRIEMSICGWEICLSWSIIQDSVGCILKKG